jgi:GMP synthase (glutamine-hydrolysing)
MSQRMLSDPDRFEHPVFCIQFHPEVTHSEQGKTMLENFVVNVCGCKQTWTPESFVEETITHLQKSIQQDKVVLGLIGRC